MKTGKILLLVICILFTTLPIADCASTPVTYQVYGLNFGPYTKDGQSPNLGTKLSDARIRELINIIGPYTTWIRTYGCTGSLTNVGSITHKAGLKIAVGAWLSKDLTANEKEIASLIKIANKGQADMLIVGSEVLLRGDLTESQLIDYINQVKQAVIVEIPVTTDDTSTVLLQHPAIIDTVDQILANIYPYWDGISVDKAVSSLNTQYLALKEIANGKQIIIGETGWPSSGNTIKNAVPLEENEALYFLEFTSWAQTTNTPYFWFEAFDEPWKGSINAPQESFWGLWNKSLKMKPAIIDIFIEKTPPPIPTPLPDLSLKNIKSKSIRCYGDIAISNIVDKTTFTLKLASNDNQWGSIGIDVGSLIGAKKLDLSGYQYVIIHAKGAKGGEEFLFGLGVCPIDYYFNKGLTTEWQDIVIDISACRRDLKDIEQIGFEIGTDYTHNQIGTKFYIKGIKFSNKLPDTYILIK